MPITEHEPGGYRDRCGRCGGWISLGHVRGSDCNPIDMEPQEFNERRAYAAGQALTGEERRRWKLP